MEDEWLLFIIRQEGYWEGEWRLSMMVSRQHNTSSSLVSNPPTPFYFSTKKQMIRMMMRGGSKD
jgi:hypothetical protein